MKVFVSYTTKDRAVTKELLANFSKQLEMYGDVFVDLLDNDSTDKQARVLFELNQSDLLVLLETKNIYNSPWVALELENAKKRHIPIKKFHLADIKPTAHQP
jgi:hypothetical protein